MPFESQNLTFKYISSSYRDVVQRYNPGGSASYYLDGLGNELFTLPTAYVGQQILTVGQSASYSIASLTSVSSSYAIVSEFSDSSSLAIFSEFSNTASLSLTALSSSHAQTASFALNAGSPITTGSTYPITASWSNQSVSASIALTASSINFVPQTSISASVASSSISASYAPIESNYSASISTVKQDTLVYGNTYPITSSWANNSLQTVSSSHALTASFALTLPSDISVNSITASVISASVIRTMSPSLANDVATKQYVDNFNQQGLDFYFRSASASIPDFRKMEQLNVPLSSSATDIVINNVSSSQYFLSFISPELNIENIQPGNIFIKLYAYRVGGIINNTIVPELYLRNGSGVEYFEFTSPIPISLSTAITSNFTIPITLTSSLSIHPSDKMICKIKCINGTSTPNIHITVENQTAAGITVPVPSTAFVLKAGDVMTGGLTASVYGTSSNAVSASWSNNSATASYVATASYYPPTPINVFSASWASSSISSSYSNNTKSASYSLTSSYVNGFVFNNTSSLITVSQSNVIVSQQNTGSYSAAYFDYVISSGSNSRSGTIFGHWNVASIVYTQYSTSDIGNTSNISMSMRLSQSVVQLIMNVPTLNWNIKVFERYL